MGRWLLRGAITIALLVALVLAAARYSPWPAVLAIRLLFDHDATRAMAALEPRLPTTLTEYPDLAYGPEPRERLDLILPPGPAPPGGWPILLWVHGGAFVSGSKENVGNYLRLIAEKGFATIAPNYTRAPTSLHPRPTEQMLEVLLWITAAAPTYDLDASRLVLAGDSAGSHIALQTTIALLDPAYARALNLRPNPEIPRPRGLALFCGVYDLAGMNLDGPFGLFLRSVLWAYLGTRDPTTAPDAPQFSLLAHLPTDLPPLFLTAGNADPLLAQTRELDGVARTKGIRVEALLFPPDHQPPLPHEYQFTLDQSGEQALDRLLAFLSQVTQAQLDPA